LLGIWWNTMETDGTWIPLAHWLSEGRIISAVPPVVSPGKSWKSSWQWRENVPFLCISIHVWRDISGYRFWTWGFAGRCLCWFLLERLLIDAINQAQSLNVTCGDENWLGKTLAQRYANPMPILYIFSVAWEELEARQHLSAPILENTGRWQAAIFVNQLSCLTNNPWLMLQSHTRHHQPLHLGKAHCQQNKAHKWVNKGGFHTPIAGWFIMENPSINDGWFRGNPHCRKPNGKW